VSRPQRRDRILSRRCLPRGSLSASDLIGQHVSATLSQFATLILKVSYNRGADLMTCLAAVKAGSTDCGKGLAAEVKTANALGVPSSSVIPFDGAGSDDQGRTTPGARDVPEECRHHLVRQDSLQRPSGPRPERDSRQCRVELAGRRPCTGQDRQPRRAISFRPKHRPRKQPGRLRRDQERPSCCVHDCGWQRADLEPRRVQHDRHRPGSNGGRLPTGSVSTRRRRHRH
jgi:hypothetical protein